MVTGEDPPQSSRASRDQRLGAAGAEVGRRLDAQRGPEDQPCGGQRPEELFLGRLRRVGHLSVRLGPEVLDDHLLQVAVALVQVAQGEQGVQPLVAGLADADQEAAGERYLGFARPGDGLQPDGRRLVR